MPPLPIRRALLLLACALSAACAREAPGAAPTAPAASAAVAQRPNVLFVVWDTTRADRVSAHGYGKPTTPFLERWAEGGRVFDDCISTGSSTVPAHGSMFTGLLPCEHGANNAHNHLDDKWVTLAELFQAGGYRTYCFAANPHIDARENFVQGFDVHEHPYDKKHRARALEIIRRKIHPEDQSNELAGRIAAEEELKPWALKAAGELAEEALLAWLDASDPERPFFAFLNYMEAHRQYIPPERYRRLFMTDEQVRASYVTDLSWATIWSYVFGLHEYTPEELEVTSAIYDACVYELDRLFESLIGALDARGLLEDTIVVLTSDHGEHLGEHHMLDHQFSLYQELVHVPLVLRGPGIEPGRVDLPVQNYDVFPTLLELTGLAPPPGLRSHAVSLLRPDPERRRVSEYPSPFRNAFGQVEKAHPGKLDPTPWDRRLRAYFEGDRKLIWGGDGRHELYDLARDAREQHDLAARDAAALASLEHQLTQLFAGIRCFDPRTDATRAADAHGMTPEELEEHRRMLEQLGYSGEDGEETGDERDVPR